MKKRWMLVCVALVLTFGQGMYRSNAPAAVASSGSRNFERETVLNVLRMVEATNIGELPAIPVKRLTLPAAGIDVLRIQMEGTYTINGIGAENIEMSGWLACLHRSPRPASDRGRVSWDNSVIDTEFVGFDIRGESKLFGPVRAYLDPEKYSYGETGIIDLPASITSRKGARSILLGADEQCCPPTPTCPATPTCDDRGCLAVMNVVIEMPQLGLKMKTKTPIRNYSVVETIPPTGTTPSFTLEPTDLLLDGRVVGSLQKSTSKHREVVMSMPFTADHVAMK
jgi:hypothetical protein